MIDDMQYLTFYIGDEILALDLLNIQEIIPYEEITHIPLMQDYILGVINLRGKIIPIVDLNKRLGLHLTMIQHSKRSIVIVSFLDSLENIEIGIVVNTVSEVFSYNGEDLEASPLFGTKIKKRFVKQEAKVDDTFIPILNIESVLDIDELSQTLQEV